MRKEEQSFLESLPEGPQREQWKKAYGAVYDVSERLRNQPAPPARPDPKVWNPPLPWDQMPMMPDPRTYPYQPPEQPFGHPFPTHVPRTLTWVEYWTLWSQPLVVDPVLESDNPPRIRLELGEWTAPRGGKYPGGYMYAWRRASEWVSHLVAGDRIAAGTGNDVLWTPGFYNQRADLGAVYWMSRLA